MPAVKLLDVRQRLDRYELVGELASGGMATVFLGRIGGVGGFQRFVAIKRLHPHLAREQEFIDMFVDEARLAAGIHHPNVVPILDIGASEDGYFLVMEYVEGDTLARLLARASSQGERLPQPIALRILLDTLAGLHAAHELRDEQNELLGVVHRDVSPQNILVGVDGTSRITDFGVAHAASRLSTTRGGQLKGKLAYMAPEQARGQTIDRRADVFAIGTVLWEVLAGRRLFKADGDAETLNRVLFEPIPRIREVDASVPAALDTIAAKALERDPDQRYASCADLADDLERAARATRLVASTRDVADYVRAVMGHEIEQQRDAVRSWLATSEPSRTSLSALLAPPPLMATPETPPRASSVSSTAITIRHGADALRPPLTGIATPAERPARRLWAMAGGAATVAILLAAAFWAKGSGSDPDSPVVPAAQRESSAASPEISSASPELAEPELAPAAPEPEPAEPVVPAASAVPQSEPPEKEGGEAAEVEPAPTPTALQPAKPAVGQRERKAAPPRKAPPRATTADDDDFIANPYR